MSARYTHRLMLLFALGCGILFGSGSMRVLQHQEDTLLLPHVVAAIKKYVVPAPVDTPPLLAASGASALGTTTPEGKPFQYVAFAFDGSRSPERWRETIDFANAMTASGTPVHFTYFINAIYLIPYAHRDLYHPPHHPEGTSFIGYGGSPEEIGQRISLINEAYASGDEIGSHGVAHIPGHNWTVEDWKSELTQFADILERAREGVDTSVPLRVPKEAIQGFRAPELVAGENLQHALDQLGYAYDTSNVSRMETWPTKLGDHWEFPLAAIPFRKGSILSMDYNFFIADSEGKDILERGTPEWNKAYEEMLAAYMNYFETNYNGNRAPVFIGHHFSDWNDGLYWEVMKEAARQICTKPDVRCATHAETMAYMREIAS